MMCKMGKPSLILALIVIQIGFVKGFKSFDVGGAISWRVPQSNFTTFYDQWAESKRFHLGDSLHFVYQNDSVYKVNKNGYYHCDTSNSSASFTDGNTYIKLEQTGLSYFISGIVQHCHNGQRLVVDVMSPHPTPVVVPPPESSAESPEPPVKPHNAASTGAKLSAPILGLLAASTSIFFDLSLLYVFGTFFLAI